MQRLVIHTGSRNLGLQVATYYQQLAIDLHQGKEDLFEKRQALIDSYKAQGRRGEIQAALKELNSGFETRPLDAPLDLCWLYGTYLDDYLHDVAICQSFAMRNRERILIELLSLAGLDASSVFHTVHNYIDTDEMILRKGAIAAHEGEKVLISLNMRDGSIVAMGKGSEERNYSAPHGAGRVLSRTNAKAILNMEDYRTAMEGMYCRIRGYVAIA